MNPGLGLAGIPNHKDTNHVAGLDGWGLDNESISSDVKWPLTSSHRYRSCTALPNRPLTEYVWMRSPDPRRGHPYLFL